VNPSEAMAESLTPAHVQTLSQCLNPAIGHLDLVHPPTEAGTSVTTTKEIPIDLNYIQAKYLLFSFLCDQITPTPINAAQMVRLIQFYTAPLFTTASALSIKLFTKLANKPQRQTQVFRQAGKSGTATRKIFHTTLMNPRNNHDGNLLQEQIPKSSRPTWLSTTAHRKSDLLLQALMELRRMRARSVQVTYW